MFSNAEIGEVVAYWVAVPLGAAPLLVLYRSAVWGLRVIADKLAWMIGRA